MKDVFSVRVGSATGVGGVVLVLLVVPQYFGFSPFFGIFCGGHKGWTALGSLDASGSRCYIAVSACAFRELLSDEVVEETLFLRS